MEVILSNERGTGKFNWLYSRHSFSFANYYDPKRTGVSALRVINDDRVIAGGGFATHAHQDMEIISYVKSGTIEHKDNMGNVQSLPAGEFQLMSAGTGVTHSEYNPSAHDPLEFLQIWIVPNERGGTPGYQQKQFTREQGLQLIASPDGAGGSLHMRQDAKLYELVLEEDTTKSYKPAPGRTLYVHVIEGELLFNDEILRAGDGASLSPEAAILLIAQNADVHALLFDLP